MPSPSTSNGVQKFRTPASHDHMHATKVVTATQRGRRQGRNPTLCRRYVAQASQHRKEAHNNKNICSRRQAAKGVAPIRTLYRRYVQKFRTPASHDHMQATKNVTATQRERRQGRSPTLCRRYVAHASQDRKEANDTFAVQVV